MRSALVNRCISIQLGDSRPTTHSRLRVAGKTGNFLFEEKGISLQPIEGGKESAVNFEDVLPTQLEEKKLFRKPVDTHLKLIYLPVKVFTVLLKIMRMIVLTSIC